MSAKTIRQTVKLPVSAAEVYEALMDSRKHARLTGSSARISRKILGAFSTFGGYASGINLDLVPHRKITQSWRASDWEPGAYSTVTFLLEPAGKKACVLKFVHHDVPREHAASIADGWRQYYWEALTTFFSGPLTAPSKVPRK
jgi:activator of HSP90 ATPase